jgi:hypothetical protein
MAEQHSSTVNEWNGTDFDAVKRPDSPTESETSLHIGSDFKSTEAKKPKYALYFWTREDLKLIAESEDRKKLEKIWEWACDESFGIASHKTSQYKIFQL